MCWTLQAAWHMVGADYHKLVFIVLP
jgi:hypothetical protein